MAATKFPREWDEGQMRQACIQGTRLELAARRASSLALTPEISECDHNKILEALALLEEARAYFESAADKHAIAAAHLTSLAEQREVYNGPAVTLRQIAEAVCRKHGINMKELKGPRRNSEYTRARHEYFYLARTMTERSYPEIGRWCGGRDHTTVLHGERKHLERMGIEG